ncbi:hypothetical protein KY314_04045 [Candidatus Woesearchaeota archaeon]|nr:hypothetical protein [Candidatus Woesearchaeota archaeon]
MNKKRNKKIDKVKIEIFRHSYRKDIKWQEFIKAINRSDKFNNDDVISSCGWKEEKYKKLMPDPGEDPYGVASVFYIEVLRERQETDEEFLKRLKFLKRFQEEEKEKRKEEQKERDLYLKIWR